MFQVQSLTIQVNTSCLEKGEEMLPWQNRKIAITFRPNKRSVLVGVKGHEIEEGLSLHQLPQ